MSRRGLTLLETLIALVILGVVALGILEVFAGASRIARSAEEWSQALTYAEDAMERLKSDPVAPASSHLQPPSPGFARHVSLVAWRGDVAIATVTVTLPDGGTFQLQRLVRVP